MKEERGIAGVLAGFEEGRNKKKERPEYRRSVHDRLSSGFQESGPLGSFTVASPIDQNHLAEEHDWDSVRKIGLIPEPVIEGYVITTLADSIRDMGPEELEVLRDRIRRGN